MHRERQTNPRERSLPETQAPRLKLRPQDQRAAPEAAKCPRSERSDHAEVATAQRGRKGTRGSAARIRSSEGHTREVVHKEFPGFTVGCSDVPVSTAKVQMAV